MATKIITKKDFIEYLQQGIPDDQAIVMTSELTGNVSVNVKRNEKKVTFSFAADAFKQKDGIGHIAFGKTPVVAFAICPKEELSEKALEIIKPK